MKWNKRAGGRNAVVLCGLLAALVVLLVCLLMLYGQPEDDTPTIPPDTVPSASAPAVTVPTVTMPEETTLPAASTQSEEPSASESQPTEESTTPPPPPTSGTIQSNSKPQTKSETSNRELTCSNYSLFSGQYVEDGRDELVENVAAILVTNNTDRFLDLATIAFTIDGQDATFIVTGLPAGESAWVMEATKLRATNSSEFVYLDCMTSFRDGVINSTEKVTITADGNMLTATNNTDQTLEGVFVYYKTVHTDGNYFGGITYLVDFGTLAPGASVESMAGHYDAGKSKLVRVGWTAE